MSLKDIRHVTSVHIYSAPHDPKLCGNYYTARQTQKYACQNSTCNSCLQSLSSRESAPLQTSSSCTASPVPAETLSTVIVNEHANKRCYCMAWPPILWPLGYALARLCWFSACLVETFIYSHDGWPSFELTTAHTTHFYMLSYTTFYALQTTIQSIHSDGKTGCQGDVDQCDGMRGMEITFMKKPNAVGHISLSADFMPGRNLCWLGMSRYHVLNLF